MVDPNHFDPRYVEIIAQCCFPKYLGTSVIDWGCASGKWVKKLNDLGYIAMGFDLVVPEDEPALFQGNLYDQFSNDSEPPCSSFGLCNGVLAYIPLQDISKQFLPRFFRSFKNTGFIFTPNSAMQCNYTKSQWGGFNLEPNTFVSEIWLKEECEKIGGFPIVLNIQAEYGTMFGPSVLWVKNVLPDALAFALSVSKKFRSFGYDGFTVSF